MILAGSAERRFRPKAGLSAAPAASALENGPETAVNGPALPWTLTNQEALTAAFVGALVAKTAGRGIMPENKRTKAPRLLLHGAF